MNTNNVKREEQLGIKFGTATHRLRKLIMFDFVKRLNLDICFQCHQKITDINSFSIEHKIPYLDAENVKELFFSLENIAFSHLSCNVAVSRKRILQHPSQESYKQGCRCIDCTKIQCLRLRKYRAKIR